MQRKGSCAFIIIGLLLVFLFALAALIYAVFILPLRTNPGVLQGMEIVKNDPAVAEMFGSPIRQSPFVTGTIETHTDGDRIGTLSAYFSGPKAKGTVGFLIEQPDGGEWQVSSMGIRIGKKLVLIWDPGQASEGFRVYNVP